MKGEVLVSQSWGVDACWMELLMAMIGEQFGSAYMSVHGAAVSRKGQTGKVPSPLPSLTFQ